MLLVFSSNKDIKWLFLVFPHCYISLASYEYWIIALRA